jgi:hypothetical protein
MSKLLDLNHRKKTRPVGAGPGFFAGIRAGHRPHLFESASIRLRAEARNVLDATSNSRVFHASYVLMERMKPYFDRDVLQTATVVVPASAMWIITERLWAAIILGAVMYLISEYVYPALRTREFSFEPFVRLYNQLRAMIRSRKVSRA